MLYTPKNAVICTTSVCSYACIFCNNPRMKDHIHLPLDKFNDIIKLFTSETIVDISGFGDVFLHPNFKEMVESCTEKNIKLSIITTGENLTEDKQEILRKSSLHRIVFSLNSLNPETKKMISGNRGNIDNVLKNCKSMMLKPRNYQVTLSFIINNYNYMEMPDFVKFGIETEPNSIQFQKLVKEVSYPPNLELIETDEVSKYRKIADDLAKENNLCLYGASSNIANAEEIEKPSITTCREPMESFYINPVGAVGVCCFLSTYNIGNIFQNTFEEIWYGKKITELRNAILSGDCKFCKKTCMIYKMD